MFGYLAMTERWIALAVLSMQLMLSTLALGLGWAQLFPALGSVLLCLGFTVFLTDRYRIAETRRLWDSQMETQLRMVWRHQMRIRHGDRKPDPLTLEELEARVSDSFESLLEAKNREEGLETYRLEIVLSVIGTLQWGFGAILMELAHG